MTNGPRLIDKSALVRLTRSSQAAAWTGGIDCGLARITSVTLTPAIEDRAIAVQALLASRGQHRAPSIPDLLIAATAELAGLVVLHDDKDYDLIDDVTGQPVERLESA